jgi:EAL domain-containing protein (putative c-di-GMP-specific phosphodiesterase class I)
MEFVTAAMPVSLLAPIAVHYQPIVGLVVTQRMVGCEALSRWHTASGELCGQGHSSPVSRTTSIWPST